MPKPRLMPLVLVGLGTAVVPLDTAVNTAFPAITKSFGLPLAMIQWVVICYVLTYASLMLAFGRANDIFSHARIFRIGLAWSTAAFLLCAAAPSYPLLLFFRFLQGIGAGLIISVAPALVTGQFPEERRGRALGVFTMMFALGSAVVPLVGGALIHAWGWPAVFWFRAPLALSALLLRGGRPAAPRTAAGDKQKREQEREPLDVAGAVLLALALSTLLLAINQAQRLGRGDYDALPLAVAALAGIVLFLRRENRVAQPIVHLEFFRHASFALINLANVLTSLTGFAVLLFVPFTSSASRDCRCRQRVRCSPPPLPGWWRSRRSPAASSSTFRLSGRRRRAQCWPGRASIWSRPGPRTARPRSPSSPACCCCKGLVWASFRCPIWRWSCAPCRGSSTASPAASRC